MKARISSIASSYMKPHALEEGSDQQFMQFNRGCWGSQFIPSTGVFVASVGSSDWELSAARPLWSAYWRAGSCQFQIQGAPFSFRQDQSRCRLTMPSWPRHWHEELKKGHTDIHVELGAPYRPNAWPRSSLDAGLWIWKAASS